MIIERPVTPVLGDLMKALRGGVVASEYLGRLLAFCPDDVRQRGAFGEMPLQVACGWHTLQTEVCCQPADNIAALLNAYPEAAAIADNSRNKFPLRYAVRNSDSGTVKLLVNAYPATAGIKCKIDGFPLIKAITRKLSHDTLKLLLDAYPAAAEDTGSTGILPL